MSPVKFGRNYSLSIGKRGGGYLNLQLPFTMEFDIHRNVLSSANTGNLRVLNLSQQSRNSIRKNVIDPQDVRSCFLRAGYQQTNPLIFTGNISRCFSVREGTDFVSQVEAFDAGLACISATSAFAVPTGTKRTDIVKRMVQDMPGVTMGAVGSQVQGQTPRGNSYNGPTIEILRQFVGGGLFIDNGKAYVLSDNECLAPNGIEVINADAGLLNTPVLEETILHFDMLFEPRLRIGQKITLQSQTEPSLNGDYKIVELHHRGTISEAVAGEATTTVGMFAPFLGQNLTVVPEV